MAWTDGDGFGGVPRDRVLDNASIYWLTASGASSARLYWESFGGIDTSKPVTVPSAVSMFPAEMVKNPRAWVEARYVDLRHWNVLPTGGHFASLEVPRRLRRRAAGGVRARTPVGSERAVRCFYAREVPVDHGVTTIFPTYSPRLNSSCAAWIDASGWDAAIRGRTRPATASSTSSAKWAGVCIDEPTSDTLCR